MLEIKDIEIHHIFYFASTIITVFLLEFFLKGLPFFVGDIFIGFTFYVLFLIFATHMINIWIYTFLFMNLLKSSYRPKDHLGQGDIYLATSAIITTFLIDDLFDLIRIYAKDFTFLIIPSILVIYFIIYFINVKMDVLEKIFN